MPGQQGFTLIELIISMVITAILAIITAFFIIGPVKGYLDTARRAELMDTVDLTLRRMSYEIGMALPNSLRITTHDGNIYLEFIPTIAGGAYRDEFSVTAAADRPLIFSDDADCDNTNNNCKFNVLGTMPAMNVNDYVVVYNLGQDANGNRYAPADAYATGDSCEQCNRAKVTGIAGSTVTLADSNGKNVFARQTPPLPSPSSRFQVVPGTRAVTYVCPVADRGLLQRHQNYGFFAAQADAIAVLGAGSTIADNARCVINYTANASQRNGLLSLRLTLFDREGGESVSLMREVHLDNSP